MEFRWNRWDAAGDSVLQHWDGAPVPTDRKEVLLLALVRERVWRTDETTQKRWAGYAEHEDDRWMDECAEAQQRIMSQLGRPDLLNDMRTAHRLFPDDPRFREIPIQVRYNRVATPLCDGGFADLPLWQRDGSVFRSTTLSDLVGDRPLVLIAGSAS